MKKTAYDNTQVPTSRSKEQIEQLLKKFNVEATRFTSLPSYATMEFVRKVGDKRMPYRIMVKPKIEKGLSIDRAERQVWRVAYWWLKSKLEAIEFGLVEFEQDFLPYMLVAADDRTVTVSEALFSRLSGAASLPGDPFGGIIPVLPVGRG